MIARRVQELHEFNPMLGHRGCRLGIVYPEITRMQARAILEAACDVKKAGINVSPEVMIPLAGFATEFQDQEKIVRETAAKVFAEKGIEIPYLVGTMIELPRAAVVADQIAKHAEFFSFGTNDLTQTTLGMSRDDYAGYINYYREHDIIPNDPFQTIDQDGVGSLMKTAVAGGRKTRPDIKLGICGEHGGDPASVVFCHDDRLELRKLLAVPRAHCPAGRRPGRSGGKEGRRQEVNPSRSGTPVPDIRQATSGTGVPDLLALPSVAKLFFIGVGRLTGLAESHHDELMPVGVRDHLGLVDDDRAAGFDG